MEKNKIKEYYDKLSKDYDKNEKKEPIVKFIDEIKFKKIMEILPRNKNIKILDAGGGTGKWSMILAKLGYKNIYLVDISRGMLNKARKNILKNNLENKIHIYENDVENLPFINNFFDFILAERNILSVTSNPKKAIHEFSRILKKNGFLYTSIKNYHGIALHNLINQYNTTHYKAVYEKDPQFILYTQEDVKDLFKKSKFKIVGINPDITFTGYLSKSKLNKILLDKKKYEEIIKKELELTKNDRYCTLGHQILIFANKTN